MPAFKFRLEVSLESSFDLSLELGHTPYDDGFEKDKCDSCNFQKATSFSSSPVTLVTVYWTKDENHCRENYVWSL